MYNDVIELVKTEYPKDEYGEVLESKSYRPVFCKVVDIGMKEFYQAQGTGLKPEIKIILPDYLEYQKEKTIRYIDKYGSQDEYTILRTYQKNLELEITCSRGVDE